MNEISGILKDSVTKQPIQGIQVQLWSNASGKYLNIQDITDVDGNFSIVNDLLNNPDTFIQTIDPSYKYGPVAGSPEFFNGATIEMDRMTIISSVPWWVWAGLALLVVVLIYFRKHLK